MNDSTHTQRNSLYRYVLGIYCIETHVLNDWNAFYFGNEALFPIERDTCEFQQLWGQIDNSVSWKANFLICHRRSSRLLQASRRRGKRYQLWRQTEIRGRLTTGGEHHSTCVTLLKSELESRGAGGGGGRHRSPHRGLYHFIISQRIFVDSLIFFHQI